MRARLPMPCIWIPRNLSGAMNVMRCLTVGPEHGAKISQNTEI